MAVKAPRLNQSHVRAIGSVEHSMLTEPQFQAINGTNWVLMDGRSVAGSQYATITGVTVLPDARGTAPRAKNNGRSDGNQNPDVVLTGLSYSSATATVTGFNSTTINEVVVGQSVTGTNIPVGAKVLSKGTVSIVLTVTPTGSGTSLTFAGDLPLGAFQPDTHKAHTHGMTAIRKRGANGNNDPVGWDAGDTFPGGNTTLTSDATGASETRIKNTTYNVFIKIN